MPDGLDIGIAELARQAAAMLRNLRKDYYKCDPCVHTTGEIGEVSCVKVRAVSRRLERIALADECEHHFCIGGNPNRCCKCDDVFSFHVVCDCGKAFASKNHRARYCSKECADEKQRERRRERAK